MIIHLPNTVQWRLKTLAEVNRSNHPKYKHYAIIYDYKLEKIIAEGYNYITKRGKSIHAEQMAIRKVKRWRLNNFNHCILIVTRQNKNGRFGNSRPCKSCEELIKKLGFKLILYSTDLTRLYDLTFQI